MSTDTKTKIQQALALLDQEYESLQAEASRRNSAYDHFGWDNTPEKLNGNVCRARQLLQEALQETATELYLVERQGVYQQGTFGIYSSLELAVAAVPLAKALEPDNYHTFIIKRRRLDQGISMGKPFDWRRESYEDEKLAETDHGTGELVWAKGWPRG